ncbi:MAG: bacteriohemerythrin [Spirochaetota bacterium]|nr:bacteriohemerythrin [Spirochaetota bacterium]
MPENKENKQEQAFITWNEQYDGGLAIMDEQHRKIVDVINELYRAVFALKVDGTAEEKEKEKAEGIKKSIRAAVEYVKVHFSTEETIMRKLDYPRYPEHKTRHEDFARRVLQDVMRFESGDRRVGMQLVAFLRDWLLEHIAVADKDLALYAKNKGLK